MTLNFSIISTLSGEVYKKVRDLQKEISKVTGSEKCLIDWQPHITIGDGIIVNEKDLAVTEEKLKSFAENHKIVKAKISGFAGIDNWKGAVEGKITPYVIWLEVELNDDLTNLYNSLKEDIVEGYETWLPRTINYKPHVTIAFADLTKEGYEKGLIYLKEKSFETEFDINNITLSECYGEGNMTSLEYKKFYLDIIS
jgi:2'-5' RNA ligase